MQWSSEYPLVRNEIDGIPNSSGVYEILQAKAYPRYFGETRILKIGMSKESLRKELLNHLNCHAAANRISRVRRQHIVTFHYCVITTAGALEAEKYLLRQFEDKYWDLPVFNSTRGYERGEDLHYRK